jgi:di/tricarboxylate transporter
MQAIEMSISAQASPHVARRQQQRSPTAFWGRATGGAAAALFAAGVWYGIPQLDAAARSALIIFGITLGAWVFGRLEETVVALAALLALALTGVVQPTAMFDSLGHSLIGLMLASFIIAAAANATGLSQWLATAVVRRARSVEQLCYWLTTANLVTALFIPATSARGYWFGLIVLQPVDH